MGEGRFRWIHSLSIGILSLLLWNLPNKPSAAQMDIIPDDTLGAENSILVIQGDNTFIEGGSSRGINLFHSFEEFNIDEGEAAYFTIGDTVIENIFSRITGNDPSDILGTLGTCVSGDCPNTKPSATLYFLNPNGIIFGPEARLDVGGSFVATTANGIQFGSQGYFNSDRAEEPSLLTVNPSAFLFSQAETGEITNTSRSDAGISPSGRSGIFGLRVPNTETLLFLGGDVKFDNGGLVVFDGQMEIGSVAGIGRVDLDIEGNSLTLNFPDTLERGNITLDNRAGLLATTATTGRDVRFHAQDISILNGSGIYLGIEGGIQNADAQSGNLNLNAIGKIVISGNDSQINNDVRDGTEGDAGNITINANSVLVSDGGTIDASVSGGGSSGQINIFADDAITVDGEQSDSYIYSEIKTSGDGSTGGIVLDAESITINGSSLVSARILGEGNTGLIIITASDKVIIDGSNFDENRIPTVPTVVSTSVQGNGGSSEGISIVTDTLQITDRAQLVSFVDGKGDSGDISISATGEVLLRNSLIITEVTEGEGFGDAGDIKVEAQSLTMNNASAILSDTEYFGNAGHITISVDGAITLDGIGPSALDFEDEVPSQISSTVEILGVGGGGDITINSGSLQMTDEAFIDASTEGQGDAGNILIDTNLFTMDAGAAVYTVGANGGSAGDIDVTVRDRFSIDGDGGGLFTDTQDSFLAFESGDDAGSSLEAAQRLDSTGDNESFYQIAGNLSGENDVDIYRISLREDNLLSASTTNKITSAIETDTRLFLFDADGNGLYFNDDQSNEVFQSTIDNVELAAGEYYLAVTNYANEPFSELGEIFDDRSSFTELLRPNDVGGIAPLQGWTEEGRGSGGYVIDVTGINGPILPGIDGGTITVETDELLLTNGAEISTETFGSGDGGLIDIDAELLALSASTIVSSTDGIGGGGEIVITGNDLLMSDRAAISSRSTVERNTISNVSANANAGDIAIAIADSLRLIDSDISTQSVDFAGGEIQIIAHDIQLQGDGDITTNVQQGQESGGDITITADYIILFDDSDIISSAPEGEGGNITLNTPAFFGEDLRINASGETDANAHADLNATGIIDGVVTTPDVSFIQNSLNELSEEVVDTATLTARSCIAPSDDITGSFIIAGSEGLPQQPGSFTFSAYPTGTIRDTFETTTVTDIQEPQRLYQLADGRVVMSRDCE